MPHVPCAERAALRLARALVRDTTDASSARVRRRDGQPVLEIAHSAFCDVRQRATAARCGFYAAALGRFLELVTIDDVAGIVRCRATDDGPCVLSVRPPAPGALGGHQQSPEVEA